ncbi:phage baseplate assembly protein W [Pseudomonas sp. TE3786]
MSSAHPHGRHLAFPFRIGSDGRTAAPVDDAAQVRDELLQLLLTSPGERLFLPEFGGGVRKLVFEPASEALRGVVKARITNGLSRWLGTRLTVEMIDVNWDDSAATLEVTVKYRPAGSPDSRVVKFQRSSR